MLGAAAACSPHHVAPSPHRSAVATKSTPTAGTSEPAASAPPGAPNAQAVPAAEVDRGSTSTRSVALTFHGAGDPALATRLLSEAENVGAHLTVLAVGTWLEANPSMAARILDGGHELGNHTWSHRAMRTLDAEATFTEIERCAELLRRLTGSAGRWFRPSGTAHADATILAATARAGYRTSLGYDVDPLDYDDPGSTAITDRVLAGAQPGAVVSLHLGHAGTVAALPAILDGLRARGLAAVTTSALLGPAQ